MSRNNRLKLAGALAAAALASCSYSPNSYSCFSSIDPAAGWAYGESYVYMPDIEDSIAQGQLALLVRHTNEYPFSNLWVEIQSQQPAGEGIEVVTDTFCITLADIYGNWLGRGTGATIEKLDTVYADFTVTDGSPLRLRHIMRPDRLEGLEKVGFIFQPFESQ